MFVILPYCVLCGNNMAFINAFTAHVSVSVSNEILPIKAHLLGWSNKTQCYYIPNVNSIRHQSIYTSHVIYIVHIK